MKLIQALTAYIYSTPLLVSGAKQECKCTPHSGCWPSDKEWNSLNKTVGGALIRGVPPASVCYADQPNYNEEACAFVRSQWFNSTWHATDPVSVDYPIWTNNSCNPIWPNGTSVTGDVNAGKNGCSIGTYPAYVVDATTPEHVAGAFKWARKHDVRVIVKNTGHSYTGRSVGYGSLSIWTHHFRGIEYIESFKPESCPVAGPIKAARVGAGETGIEIQAALADHNAITVIGGNPDVGVIGWLTGGGHGFLSTTYGMGADNLLEATIVTPCGETLVANPCQNSDIFFAIRGGGGGTYGVITEAVVKAFPSPRTTQHIFAFQALSPNVTTEYWDMIGFLHAEMPRLKAGGMQGYYFLGAPPTVPTYSFLWGFYLYDKPNGTVEALMEPIEARLKNQSDIFMYISNITQGDTFFDVWGSANNELVATGGSTYGSWLMSPESLADADKTARVLESIGPSIDPSKPNGPSNPSILGHMIAHPNEPTYYPNTISMNPAWRNTLTHMIVVEGWPDGAPQPFIDSVYKDITSTKIPALRKLSPNTGAYFNEADSNQPDWQQVFFGENYERLRSIKKKYDPDNVLWCRLCVGSEALVERDDGALCKARSAYPVEGKGIGIRRERKSGLDARSSMKMVIGAWMRASLPIL